MADIDRLRMLRAQVQRAAIERWQARAAARESNQTRLASSGPGGADSPTRQARLAAREAVLRQATTLRAIGQLPIGLERKIGPTLDFFAAAPSEAARKAGRPVARIVDCVDPEVQANGFGTGFLVAPTLLLTNWHVLPSAADAVGVGANFLHERDERGVRLGETFELDPTTFFLANQQLDYAIVAVKPRSAQGGEPLADLGIVTLVEATPKILIGQAVNIVEYPEGREKVWATTNNRLLDVLDEGFLHYETDTLEGASGSPVFSASWELVGLHHAGVPEMRDGHIVDVDGKEWHEEDGDARVHWIANEGIRVSAIVRSLTASKLDDATQAKLLADLLASTSDPVDEVTQIVVKESAPVPSSPVPVELAARTGNIQFSFSGPVTIHVYAPQPMPAAQAVVPALEKTIRFDRDYTNRRGYDEAFLGADLRVPVPGVAPARMPEMLMDHEAVLLLPYHHFTLAMNAKRRLQMWSAVNVDYDPRKKPSGGRVSFGADRWIPDPRIPERCQIFDSEFYAPAGQVDRGHIVRREDNAWGTSDLEIEFANSDTFHWTNCTPQHQAFNRDTPGSQYGGIHGLWGSFEEFVEQNLQQGDTRACILAGPVLAPTDPVADFGGGPVQYPLDFWKVVVVPVSGALKAYGFMLSQKDVVTQFGVEAFEPGMYRRYEVPLQTIEAQAGVTFDASLHAVDAKR